MARVFGARTKASLIMPKGSSSWDIKGLVKKGDYNNLLLMTFSIQEQEMIDVRRCFNEITHIFAFGRNAHTSILEISFLIALYNGCRGGGKKKWAKISDIRSKYNKQRIYKNNKPVSITIDDLNMQGFLISMEAGNINPSTKLGIINFKFLIDQEV